ncbi:nucleotidyltransferase domain-containing protein [Mitsuaria sp. 7]|uniref:nucleotidyltransferase domain-containing protein n=1 Tax=Mitsuaria sp. 7 TaxID=1658665 RepID=UPI00083537DC|nr:nucleotidyltransferase domain-containing protein [Mitsuaria sp. 7]
MSELVGGAARYRALRCLYEQSEREFGTRELAAAAEIDPSNASRWLRRWTEVGLVDRKTVRGLPVFQASTDPALAPLRALVMQDSELVRVMREHLATIKGQVDVAALFGSAARADMHSESDVDLLVLTPDLSRLQAQAHFKPAGRALKRAVNVLVYTPEDWRQARDDRNPFVLDILGHPTIELKGSLHAR